MSSSFHIFTIQSNVVISMNFPFVSKKWQAVINKIATEAIYIEGRNEIALHSKDYENKTDSEQHAFWAWFHHYVDDQIHWMRKHVYVLYSDFIISTGQEKLIDDYSEYFSGIIGECATSSTIPLKSDPAGIDDLYDYVHS